MAVEPPEVMARRPWLRRAAVGRAVAELRADLESGVWHERHAGLLEQDEIDLGRRLISPTDDT